MQEEFLHYLWKFRLFDGKYLLTQSGDPIEILKVGESNSDSGPDFFNAKIKIGKTLWAGNVEIHVHASDWEAHKHQNDKAYDNVILHVVHEADKELKRKNGEILPTLELKGKIPEGLYKKYLSFKESKDWIPCGKQVQIVSSFTLTHWFDRLLIERLERKTLPIIDSLSENQNNWEETFYRHLAYGFGLKVNAQPFELLAKSLPLNILAKHKDSFLQIEALLFGQAGMLDPSPSRLHSHPSPAARLSKGQRVPDDYFLQLQKEYEFLKKKFKLKPIDSHLWKFMRLHPPNFPTIRIAQFANLIYKSLHLFSKMIESTNIYTIRSLLHAESSEYWITHYRFGKSSPSRKKILGEDTKNLLLINTIVPFLFVYAKQKGEPQLMERALDFLDKTEAERNSIIAKWNSLGIKSENAYQTQALLQLKNEYCSKKRCLECEVGAKLLHPTSAVV
ncbi:MAG: DUF2851 family protein [Bacteroidetes bacterium]|nr:MAG: DUF2851 family protein [Bacteroidota bacterium]